MNPGFLKSAFFLFLPLSPKTDCVFPFKPDRGLSSGDCLVFCGLCRRATALKWGCASCFLLERERGVQADGDRFKGKKFGFKGVNEVLIRSADAISVSFFWWDAQTESAYQFTICPKLTVSTGRDKLMSWKNLY